MLTRRSVIAGAAALIPAAAPVASAGTDVHPDAELLATYEQWKAHRREWYRIAHLNDPADAMFDSPRMVAESDGEWAARCKMLACRPKTPEGFAALAHLLWDEAGPSSLEGSADYAEQSSWPDYEAILAIWRCGPSADYLPPRDPWAVRVPMPVKSGNLG